MLGKITIDFDFIETTSGAHYKGSCSIPAGFLLGLGARAQHQNGDAPTMKEEAVSFIDRHKEEIVAGTFTAVTKCVDAITPAKFKKKPEQGIMGKLKDATKFAVKKP